MADQQLREPSWLGNAIGGVITAGILQLNTVLDDAKPIQARLPALAIFVLCATLTLYHYLASRQIRFRVPAIAVGLVCAALAHVSINGWVWPTIPALLATRGSAFLQQVVPLWSLLGAVGVGTLLWIWRARREKKGSLSAQLAAAQQAIADHERTLAPVRVQQGAEALLAGLRGTKDNPWDALPEAQRRVVTALAGVGRAPKGKDRAWDYFMSDAGLRRELSDLTDLAYDDATRALSAGRRSLVQERQELYEGLLMPPGWALSPAGIEFVADAEKKGRLRSQSPNDELTGIPNRTAYERDLSAFFAKAKEDHEPLAFVMLDVDHFKKVNDNYGHAAGDEVLSGVARILASVVRGKGTAYRYGGEEFALLLPNHNRSEGVQVAERARKAIETASFDALQVTASCGVAVFPEHANTAENLAKRSDKALYAAKEAGRNAVLYYGETAGAVKESGGVVGE